MIDIIIVTIAMFIISWIEKFTPYQTLTLIYLCAICSMLYEIKDRMKK